MPLGFTRPVLTNTFRNCGLSKLATSTVNLVESVQNIRREFQSTAMPSEDPISVEI